MKVIGTHEELEDFIKLITHWYDGRIVGSFQLTGPVDKIIWFGHEILLYQEGQPIPEDAYKLNVDELTELLFSIFEGGEQ